MPVLLYPIPGFPGYSVTQDGRVFTIWEVKPRSDGSLRVTGRRLAKERVMDAQGQDYLSVSLWRRGIGSERHKVHRLILLVFIGPCPEGHEGCHRNGIKKDNRAANLYWGTRADNTQDAIKHGTFYRASAAGAAAVRGRKRPPEECEAISAKLKGKPKSEAHKESVRTTHWSRGPNAAEIIARREATKRVRGNNGSLTRRRGDQLPELCDGVVL